jgi:hypothetical protein
MTESLKIQKSVSRSVILEDGEIWMRSILVVMF